MYQKVIGLPGKICLMEQCQSFTGKLVSGGDYYDYIERRMALEQF
ncbi:MAG TPA: hypothetical protein P5268_08305 [Candidatus Marinimicrobia bacterium]|nr:hypothetical protein [Candidatus Neomarinimicrobiota bacterium]HRU93015.1 hypothetical protein [Candidatus Neomarinimicrobiota bacterium]